MGLVAVQNLVAGSLGTLLVATGNNVGYGGTTMMFIAIVSCTWYIIKAAALKHFIARRITILSNFDSVEQVIKDSCKILACNTDLNSSSQLFVTMYQLWAFLHLLKYPYDTWIIVAENFDLPTAFENYPAIAILDNCGLFMLVLSLGIFSSRVCEEIDCLMVLLDQDITMKLRPRDYRKKVSAFQLELQQTPVELSASGLFNIPKSALGVAFVSVISYIMVFIQFT